MRFRIDKDIELLVVDPTTSPLRPMKPFLMLDLRDGEIDIKLAYSIDGIPKDIWNGVVRGYPIPHSADKDSLIEHINTGKFDVLFESIVAGATVEWDGSNYRGHLTDSALEAEEVLLSTLADYMDYDGIRNIWEPAEWLEGIDLEKEYNITKDTPDTRLKQIADEIEENARLDGAIVVNTFYYLAHFRDELDN